MAVEHELGLEQWGFALLEYLDRNHRRLHSEIGMITPVENETNHYAQRNPGQTTASKEPRGGSTNHDLAGLRKLCEERSHDQMPDDY